MKRLTEEELKRRWPFDRLDPKLFPAPTKKPNHPEDVEDALL